MVKVLSLDTKIVEVPGIGLKIEKRLKKLGIKKVRDLIFYFPRRWDDLSNIIPISKIYEGEVAVWGRVCKIQNKRTRRFRFITLAKIADSTGFCEAVWYHQPYLTQNIKQGDNIVIAGRAVAKGKNFVFQSHFTRIG